MGRLTHTVSGSIASIRTPSRVPIESLKFHFLPKQASGTPSPENPIPIEGWTGLNGRRSGKNLIKPYYTEPATYYGIPITPTTNGVRVTGIATIECAIRLSSQNVRFLEKGKKYTFSLYVNGDISGCKDPYIGYFDGVSYWGTMGTLNANNNYKLTWTVPERYSNAVAPWFDMYIRIREGSTVDFEIGLQMEEGSNATDYEPYSGEQIPITFPISGKNKFDPRCQMISTASSYSVNSDKIIQTTSDGRAWKSDTQMPPVNLPAGTYTISCSDGGVINLMTSADGYETAMRFANGVGTFTIGENVGIKFKHSASSYPATFTIQIESGSVVTNYEPFLPGGLIYGGYVDPIVGELVAEWGYDVWTGTESIGYNYKNTNGAIYTIVGRQTCKYGTEGKVISNILQTKAGHGLDNRCSQRPSDPGYLMDFTRETICDLTLEEFNELTASQLLELVKSYITELYSNGTPLTVCYKLLEPIHITIPAEDMKAFLDHNNFWSDANDVTEVTYPVNESRDILSTRKKAIAFDQGKHKKVKWNNIAGGMNDQYWVKYNSNMIDVEFDNNEALITVKDTSQMPFSMSIRTNGNPIVYSDHYYYVSYCLYPYFDNAYFGAEFGNNVYTGYFHFEKNEWSRFSYRAKAGGDGLGRMYIPYLKPGSYAIGDSVKIKNAYYIDLTQMFGAGNEPLTVAEFERICAINGIDLTTYQPYDEGSDRWLIIP